MASMTTTQIVARLARDGYDRLVWAVRNREMTAHAAAALVGYIRRKPTKSAPGVDPRSKRRLAIDSLVMREMK
jgi:hypothetical protein